MVFNYFVEFLGLYKQLIQCGSLTLRLSGSRQLVCSLNSQWNKFLYLKE